MNETTNLPHERKGSWFGLIAKIIFFITVILCVLLAVLSSLGGSSEPLRQAVEQFFGQRLGGRASVEKLNQLTFYPYMGADFENLSVIRRDDENNVIFSIEQAAVAMGFWDITFSTGKIKALNVKNLRAIPGTLLRKGVSIDHLVLIDEGDEAFVRSEGKIGSAAYQFEAPIEKFGKGKSRKYAFGDVRPFSASLADITMTGRMETLDSDVMEINSIALGRNGQNTLQGNLTIYYGGEGRITVQGELNYGTDSVIKPDILLETNAVPPKISGELVFETLDYDDALNYEVLVDLIDDLKDHLFDAEGEEEQPGYDWSNIDIDGKIIVKALTQNETPFAAFQGPVVLENGVFQFGPLTSDFEGASGMDGQFIFDTSKTPSEFSGKLRVKEWDYIQLQRAFNVTEKGDGSAAVVLDLKSAGQSKEELKANLNGHVSFIAGEADYPVESLNMWGAGLVNSMLPGLDQKTETKMNCAVADFEFKDGIGEVNAFFLDTDLVTVVGQGEYDYPQDNLDISLQPNSKNVELFNIRAVPVVLEGPLHQPEISASTLGLVKKIGGISLGLVNPAFLVYSLSDLGLSESHPCRPYLQSDNVE